MALRGVGFTATEHSVFMSPYILPNLEILCFLKAQTWFDLGCVAVC